MTTWLLAAWASGYMLLLMKAARLTREAKIGPVGLLVVVLFMALWPLWILGLVGVWLIGMKSSKENENP